MVDVEMVEIIRSRVQKLPLGTLDNRKFPAVLKTVIRGLRDGGHRLPKDEAALIAAVCILTRESNPLAEELVPHLLALLGLLARCTDKKKRTQMAIDCAIAYGVGWRRQVVPTTSGRSLGEAWQSSIELFTRRVGKALEVANYFLNGTLRSLLGDDGAKPISADLKEGLSLVRNCLTWRLIAPEFRSEDTPFPLRVEGKEKYTELFAPDQLRRLPPGSRYVFGVSDGWISASFDDRVLSASAGDRFVVRAQDFGGTEIRFPIASNSGPLMRLKRSKYIVMRSVFRRASIALWECGCGSWECPNRHRLSGWVPGPISLTEFVDSAINGRNYPLTPGSFIDGMYYAYLCRDATGDDDLFDDEVSLDETSTDVPHQLEAKRKAGPNDSQDAVRMPRIRRVLLVDRRDGDKCLVFQFIPLYPLTPTFRPARVLRCEACEKYIEVTENEVESDETRASVSCSCGQSTISEPITAWYAELLSRPEREDIVDKGRKRPTAPFLETETYAKLNAWTKRRLLEARKAYVRLRPEEARTIAKRKTIGEKISLLIEMEKTLASDPELWHFALRKGIEREFWTLDEIKDTLSKEVANGAN